MHQLVSETPSLPRNLDALVSALTQYFREHGFAINQLLQRWNPVTPAQITADQNDYDIKDAQVLRLSSDLARTITGFARGEVGRVLLVVNVGANAITISHQSVSSQAQNRVITTTGVAIILTADGRAWLWYDDTTQRWRQVV